MKALRKSVRLVAAMALLVPATVGVAQNPTNKVTNPPPSAANVQRRNAGMVDSQLARYVTMLELTADQKPKVRTALEAQQKAMSDAPPEQRRQIMTSSRNDFAKTMKGILTAEQFQKFQTTPGQSPPPRPPGAVPPEQPH